MNFTDPREIVVRPEDRLAKGVWNGVIFMAWLCGFFIAEKGLSNENPPLAVLLVVSSVFVVFGALIIANLLWIVAGARRVTSGDGDLVLIYEVLGLKIGRAKRYQIKSIIAPEVEERSHAAKGKRWTTFSLVFTYDGVRAEFAKNLEKTSAESLLSWIKNASLREKAAISG